MKPCAGFDCHGVLYTVTREEWRTIQRTEGVGSPFGGYRVVEGTFLTYPPGLGRDRRAITADDPDTAEVEGYTLEYSPPPLGLAIELPSSRRYLGLLRAGAREKGLCERAVRRLDELRPFL